MLSAYRGDILWFGNGIEVREQGYRNPVVTPNPVVAADHNTGFSRFAPAHNCVGSCADPRQVDCGMPRPSERAVIAIRLFQQYRDVRTGLRRKT